MTTNVSGAASGEVLPSELRFARYPSWLRYGAVSLAVATGYATAAVLPGYGFYVGSWAILIPAFVATLVRRRREVRRVIRRVEEIAPSMTTPQLTALVHAMTAHWDDALNNDMQPLHELVERRKTGT